MCFLVPLLLAGCRGEISQKPPLQFIPNMDQQEKYLPQAASPFFASGGVLQAPPDGTVARGSLKENELFFTGKSFWEGYVKQNPLQKEGGLEARGRERFKIFCTPCHGVHGDGNGVLFTRGHVKSANLLEDKITRLPDGRLFEVISDGLGMMPPYRYQIPPHDRWAIVAYLRVLEGQAAPEGQPPVAAQAVGLLSEPARLRRRGRP